MSSYRLPTILIIAALIAVTVLTVREAFATNALRPSDIPQSSRSLAAADRSYDRVESLRTDRQSTSAAGSCLSALDRASLSSTYIEGAHGWFPRSAQGFTGIDGGLMELLSNHGQCSIGRGE